MKTVSSVLGGLAALAVLGGNSVSAKCAGGCSGHGNCNEYDQCDCFPGWISGTCSYRQCPFGNAWADPIMGDLNFDGDASAGTSVKVQGSNAEVNEVWQGTQAGEAHFPAECSAKGVCNRGSGECECFPGYTGAACQRVECPDDCSGHGVCRTAGEIAAGALNKRREANEGGSYVESGVTTPFTYNLWDKDMTQACVCDPGWAGFNCAERQCPRGDDPVTDGKRYCGGLRCHDSVQEFDLLAVTSHLLSFSLEDWTGRTHVSTMDIDTQNSGPGFLSDADAQTGVADDSSISGQIMLHLRNTFPNDMLKQVEVRCIGSVNSANLDQSLNGLVAGSCQSGSRNRYQITFVGLPGRQELISLQGDSIDTTAWGGSTQYASTQSSASANVGTPAAGGNTNYIDENGEHYTMYGNREEITCSGRGSCDTGSGICNCFPGYYGAACEHQNALVM